MPRRKQICPKRMQYDGKEGEEKPGDTNSITQLGDNESDTGDSEGSSPNSPGSSPSSPRDIPMDDDVDTKGGETHEDDPDARIMVNPEEKSPKKENDKDELVLPTKVACIMDPVHLEKSKSTSKVAKELSANGRAEPPRLTENDCKSLKEEKDKQWSPKNPPSPESSSPVISGKDLPLPRLSQSDNHLDHHAVIKNRNQSEWLKGMPTLVSDIKGLSHDKHLHKTDMNSDEKMRHKTREGYHIGHKSHTDRYRDSEHRRSSDNHSPRYHEEHRSRKSLARKYAELFSSPKDVKKSTKEERLSSPVSASYEPLKAVQAMVKAAERRSPTAPPTTPSYHSRFNYLKGLSSHSGSPSSLEALQRVVDKERHSTEKRPSVVQSMNSAISGSMYQKYLPLIPSGSHRERTPPSRTPEIDPDKPLDLSVKPKKPKSSSSKSSRGHEQVPYLSPPDLNVSASSTKSTSSLATLEKAFGEDSFMFDRIGAKHFNTPIRQFYMSAFGMGIYSTALNNSYPFPNNAAQAASMAAAMSKSCSFPAYSQSLQATNRTPKSSRTQSPSPVRKASTSSATAPMSYSEDSSKSYVPSKFMEQVMKPEPNIDMKKHTNLQCSCGADFETLYQLTLHLQETGHPANKTRNGTQHEYPKLVRGQDMWLNHGSEQTKQILRCMQCGESFKSLPELTVHMIETKHYTNIVGADPQGKPLRPSKSSLSMSDCSDSELSPPHRCPKCSELFDDIEALVYHQEKTGHLVLKGEPGLKQEEFTPPRPTSALSDKDLLASGGARSSSSSNGSLIHYKRRLLDSINDRTVHADEDSRESSYSSHSVTESSRIRCENCGDRIHTDNFVEHVRLCVKHMRSPRQARSRSRSRSPIDSKYPRDYMNGEYKRGHSRDRRSQSRDSSSEYCDAERLKFYNEYFQRLEQESKLWSPHQDVKTIKTEPDSSQGLCNYTSPSATELVKPADSSEDSGSALKAMESFIEKSFTHNPTRKPVQSSSLFASSLFARNFFSAHPHLPSGPPERPRMERMSPITRHESPSPQQKADNSHLYQNKYLPPLYMPNDMTSSNDNAQNDAQIPSPVRPVPKSESPKSPDHPFENGIEKTPDKNDNTVISTPTKKRPRELSSENIEHFEPDKKKPRDQYLPEKLSKPALIDDEKDRKSSALQSLQGLVYGKSFNTEHPLDSLQKLIHTNSTSPSTQTISTSRAVLSPSLLSSTSTTTSLHTSLPGTVILVNPIVTVVANSKGGSPSLQISLPPGSPKDSSHEPRSPDSDSNSNHGDRSPIPEGDGDSNSEYRCVACNRNFASKGSYRYHLSRCHWSTVKKFRVKENINVSPYVYLPLDHSAKFNKYYEMANELANKGK